MGEESRDGEKQPAFQYGLGVTERSHPQRTAKRRSPVCLEPVPLEVLVLMRTSFVDLSTLLWNGQMHDE